MKKDRKDRIKGSLYGLAIGDALGAAVEFKAPGTFPPVTGYRGGGPHGIAAGEWTDDTSMALALANSLALVGWSLSDQMNRYCAWQRRGRYSVNGKCFDIGGTTAGALRRYELNLNPYTSGAVKPTESGNGGIMRLAPAAAWAEDATAPAMAELCRLSSLPTHASPECLRAAEYMGHLFHAFYNGMPMFDAIQQTAFAVPGVWPAPARENYKPKGTGYVIDSLRSALWALANTNSFESAVLKAVNLGHDADTTGAVCGQLAGAYYGYRSIPVRLVKGLGRQDLLNRYFEPLLEIC